MLRRLCHEQPRQGHRFINPLLFAYREARQKATGFSPFELLCGRTVRGPVQILKELWSEEEEVPEVKTSYQYVLELRESLDETMKLAQAELERNQGRNKNLSCAIGKQRNSRWEIKSWCYFPLTKTSCLCNGKVRLRLREPSGETITRSKSTRR